MQQLLSNSASKVGQNLLFNDEESGTDPVGFENPGSGEPINQTGRRTNWPLMRSTEERFIIAQSAETVTMTRAIYICLRATHHLCRIVGPTES